MDVTEARLFRILSAIFSPDKVVFNMSASIVCSSQVEELNLDKNLKCLFTIIDDDDNPCMVVDIEYDSSTSTLDMHRINTLEKLSKILPDLGIKFVTISRKELDAVCLDAMSRGNFKEFCELVQVKIARACH